MHVIHLDLERTWRGGERQVLLLIEALARGTGAEELRQSLVARRGSPLARRAAELPDIEVIPVANRWQAWRRLPRSRSTTVFHAHTGNTIPLAVFGAGRRGAALITRRLDLPVRSWLFRRADAVVAISQRVADVLGAAGVAAERLHVIPSAIDPRRVSEPDTGRLRSELGVATGSLGLTVAALVEQKDPLTLVRALAHLPDDYVHAWVGEGDLRREVEQLAERLGVADRLRLPGFDPQPDRWFAVANVFVLPSVHEGLGSVLLDAFRFGVPVVGSRIPGTAELLEDGDSARLFEAGDAPGLAAAVSAILGSPDLAEKLRDGARRRLPAHDIRITAASYLRLYHSLVAPRAPSGQR